MAMTGVPWAVIKRKAAAKRAAAVRAAAPCIAVRAYGMQVWAGRDEQTADGIVAEYRQYLNVDARKVIIR